MLNITLHFFFPEIANCESDIAFFAKRRHPDTRQWFFDDFDEWFRDPGESRAYVLLGDPGVGKSVMAAVMAQRMRKTEQLGAAYFCCHNDDTRKNPRYLLGTVACQLCDCNTQYKETVGGDSGVKMLLGNSNLGVRELFTKLLQEPLSECSPCSQRKLVIIDALDETEYDSRENFLDLIMHRLPMLPKWLVFFITSRPEELVQLRLKKYNPCVKICAGNRDQDNFYLQHEQDIQTFLEKRIDFSRLSVTVEDISKTCNGLFLYAHYIVEELRLSAESGKKLNQLSDLFPGDIDSFFQQNFQRVYDQVGQDIFKRLFGCAIVAPAPLPVSIISYILKRENSNHDEQQVIDAVSQFEVLRTSDQTLTFLHNLIPAWLTDKNKARKLFIDKKIAGEYLTEIFVEVLSSIVNNESRPTCLSTDINLEDYVLRVAVRFLCQNGAKDSLKAVFDCLTSYQFIERRIQSGRVEIYHLLDDLRLASGSLPLEEVSKNEILQEILFVLENNVLVLLECPHVLHSCIRNASNAVRETVSIPREAAPWLEWVVYAFPDPTIADMKFFATSPDRKTVAGANFRSLLLFDASTTEKVSGPFNLNKYCTNINHLEFSPDGEFIFFGRLDKWFSVERSCVEDFPQFSGNSQIYEWGVVTHKGQHIVVKMDYFLKSGIFISQVCSSRVLALWALKEIEQGRDDEMTVSFFRQVLYNKPGEYNQFFSHRLRVRKYLDQSHHNLCVYDPPCCCCIRLAHITRLNPEPSLATVRELVIELYPFIFDYQVWDLQTGMPVLQHLFLQDIQLNPFTYLFHVTCAFSECGLEMGCSGIQHSMSVCNIAVVNAFIHCESDRFSYAWQLERQKSVLEPGCSCICQGLVGRVGELEREMKAFWKLKQVLKEERKLVLMLQLELVWELWNHLKKAPSLNGRLVQLLKEALKFELKMEQKKVQNEEFNLDVCCNSDGSFQNLVYDINEEIRICVSPETNWIEAGDVLRKRLLQTGNQDRHHRNDHHRNADPIISKFTDFTRTNDELYFVYSCEGSLRARSLQTGTILTSVSGCNPVFLRERQVGYLFRSDTEERAILLTSLLNPFKFLTVSPVKPPNVGISIGAIFRSRNTVLSIRSDSIITVWETTSNRVALFGKSLLKEPGVQSLSVKNCLLSPDGRLIAIHKKTKVELYSFRYHAEEVNFLYSVYESNCEFTVACFSFSADSTLLLFCIQDSRHYPYLYVWDVQQKVMAASRKSPGLLTTECCCFSWDKRLVILCGEYEIEILEYAKDTCRRLGVERPYHSVRFGQCTVSSDNQLLVCCIANRILLYNLLAPDIKQVLRGHLGRIEFCRFLKANYYLISYGVDGMVFLWDINELKAVAFARITQGKEKIVAMAVSPEEDLAVCFTSSDRVCMIKLCGLGAAPSLKPLTLPSKRKLETAETSLHVPRQIASTSTEDDMAESSSSSDSEEDVNDYYQEHDVDADFM